MIAQSNPILVLEEASELYPYWADFHGQSEETIGSNTIDAYFKFARDMALLDIASHQGNDFQIADAYWQKINATTDLFYEPGVFVTFPGYEWSGNTPLGGDRNVFFSAEGGEIVHSSAALLHDKGTPYTIAPTAAELFKALSKQEVPRPFGFAHVGGRYADISAHDPEIELAVEVHSDWGTFEWLVEEALQRGYRVGICANSDGHKGRAGAWIRGAGTFGSYGGLTCVLATALDRESVLQALTARHFYATTGNRCLMDVKLTTADGHSAMMGDLFLTAVDTANLHVQTVGSAPIERIQVRNGLDVIETLCPNAEYEMSKRIKIVWSGAEVRGRDRMVAWHGGLALKGNSILDATPINFWNPLQTLDDHQLSWRSNTTGGIAGVILTLEKPETGLLEIKTVQGDIVCEIAEVGRDPVVWPYGGLRKQVEIYRLPDRDPSLQCSFNLSLMKSRGGDNPIYIHMVQEDGHMAWTSPIYWV
ncbi:MAG: DUF3604 domain-containing protein [Chloroflexi bacterium]|nr:DUF3604 domain-containing protein [Chloroflexota bacterium]